MKPDSLNVAIREPGRARLVSRRPVLPEFHSLPLPSQDSLEHILVPLLDIF